MAAIRKERKKKSRTAIREDRKMEQKSKLKKVSLQANKNTKTADKKRTFFQKETQYDLDINYYDM